MASLNTLRTKFGVLLSVIIAGALLAFILSLKAEMGFTGNDPKIGVIDGEKITYSEYYKEYENVKAQSGAQENDEQQSAMLANAVWQSLISKHVMEPGFDRMGLRVTEAELLAMIGGDHPSQTFATYFTDPRTGIYDVAGITEFLAAAETDPNAQAMWARINTQAAMERQFQKYAGLVRRGAYVNALEVENGVNNANRTFSGEWIGKKYNTLPDSLFNISDAEIKSFYNSHKSLFKQLPSRNLSYVVFEVAPTEADELAISREAESVGAEFAATEDVKTFTRSNRNGSIADNFVAAAQLTELEREALMADKTFGPVLKNNEWTMSRVVESKMAPDTIGVRHIVLSFRQEQLADSLMTVLRNGGDFAALAAEHSLAATASNGGDAGVYPFSAFSGEFAEALGNAKEGDIVKVASGDALQVMQVYRATKPSKHLRIATISYPLRASEATRRNIHNEAGTFSVNAKGSEQAFNEAATAAALTPRMATINQGDRTIRGLEDSREVTRWAYDAEVGDVSEIFNVGDDYVIAILTGIDDNDYASIEKATPRIRQQLLRDKRYDSIAASVAGESFEEKAASLGCEVESFENAGASLFIPGMGYEPRVVGALAAAEEGAVVGPIKGSSGLYYVKVGAITTAEKQTAEGERVRAQAMVEGTVQQQVMPAIQQMAEIEDLRGRYF